MTQYDWLNVFVGMFWSHSYMTHRMTIYGIPLDLGLVKWNMTFCNKATTKLAMKLARKATGKATGRSATKGNREQSGIPSLSWR